MILVAGVVVLVVLAFAIGGRQPLSLFSPALRLVFFISVVVLTFWFVGGKH